MFAIISFLSLQGSAQGFLPAEFIGMPVSGRFYRSVPFDSLSNKKWSLSRYSGISTSFSIFNGGSATVFSAPVGLQLNRKITNNLYAFAGVNLAPSYVNFNQAFLNSTGVNKLANGNSFMYSPNGFALYRRAELGLMYTNDERTFQISGSIGIERKQYPAFGGFQNVTPKSNRQIIVR